MCGLSVGYNPDFIVRLKSDVVVKGDLLDVLPRILGADETIGIRSSRAYKSEVLREAIHVGGFSIPLLCAYLLDRYLVAILILVVTLLFVASEITRLRGGRAVPIFQGVTLRAAGGTEAQEFVLAPVFFALGIIFSLILFPTPVNYVSITILTLGDSSASIFGKRLGRRVIPYNKGKMVEGTLCGFLSAFCGALLFVSPLEALIAASTGMLFETLPFPIDDNITIPMSSGLALTIFQGLI
jgi:dolichol kinase